MGNEEQRKYDDEPVSKLLGSLKRVNAPSDFDFGVKARIAKGKPADKHSSWLPASVRYAVPLGLLLLIGGYFAFNAFYSTNNLEVPAVVVEQKIKNEPSETKSSNDVAVLPPEQITADRGEIKSRETTANGPTNEREKQLPGVTRPGGGSYVDASKQPQRLLPRGFNPNAKTPSNPKGFDRNVQVPAGEILTFLGVKSAFADGNWKTEAVAPNSVAERSGVKTGDVIEAVNDQPLTEKTTFGGSFNGKSLRVKRDGQSVMINLKP